MARVEFEHVSKSFEGDVAAVKDFTLQVPDGEFMVLVGPSGCGKTTLLRIVAGLEECTTGTIVIGDRVVNDLAPRARDIAMVFQNYSLYPHKSVYGNLAFALRIRKVDKREIDRRVRQAAQVLGLEDLLDRRPRHLSGGQRQRVAMGRAIVREPQAFLMDEPLSNLDAKLRVQMRAEISRIQKRLGVTTIYVTHDQTEALTMGDRVAVLNYGVLQQVDSPDSLYEHPVNLFVASFVGSPAMNMATAVLECRTDHDWRLHLGDQLLDLDADVAARCPGMAAYDGRQIVMGMRPEHLEDATLATASGDGHTLPALVELRETVGSEVFVHLRMPGVELLDETRLQSARGGIDRSTGPRDTDNSSSVDGTSGNLDTFVIARFSSRSKASLGERISVAVEVDRLHFFDPDTGLAL
jgi:multiple sugar transport system ATP-binding protein